MSQQKITILVMHSGDNFFTKIILVPSIEWIQIENIVKKIHDTDDTQDWWSQLQDAVRKYESRTIFDTRQIDTDHYVQVYNPADL